MLRVKRLVREIGHKAARSRVRLAIKQQAGALEAFHLDPTANRHLDVARSRRRLRKALMKDRQLPNYNDFSNTRSSFLSASEGNALSS
jgi:hypothetical protein